MFNAYSFERLLIAIMSIAFLATGQPVTAADRTIHWYAANKKMQDVKRLIAANPSLVNARDSAGATPLIKAAGSGNEEMVAFLLSKGADPNAANNSGAAPLHYISSAIRPNPRVADLLLQHGAGMHVRNVRGGTALHSAARAAVPAMIVYWVNQGMDVRVTDNSGRQPIHYIARAMWKVPEAVDALLAAGADINAHDNKGMTPLQIAMEQGNKRAVQALEERGAK